MDETIISNTSYTDKDFQTIYPELLNLVKELTDKWDPSISNESDPGVILLKLNALIADKNNYNIDKNVLECFPLSVTQLGNARKLYDSLGYKMHWYISASTNINFKLTDITNLPNPYTIERFTQISDETGEYVYTLTQPVELYTNNLTIVSCPAIEGTCNNYSINGTTQILLTNLDENLRLYFTETQVAQNGIFISDDNGLTWDAWSRVDNLVSYPTGNKAFEFGVLPNSDTCYIQFPSDIATLINNNSNNSLMIKYVISKGLNGIVKPKTINSFLNQMTVPSESEGIITVTDQIAISQPMASINGFNPESIDEAYNTYKKSVGTFNTLVTKQDYQNFIYNAQNNSNYIVSNGAVSDRTSDLNSSTKIKTLTPNSNETKIQSTMNAFDVRLYTIGSNNGIYNDTFNPNTDCTEELKNLISEIKAVEHNVNNASALAQTLIYLLKNITILNGQLVTYYKVTKSEAKEIQTNVYDALKNAYNSRNLTYGKSIEYSDFINTIQNADSRIRSVALDLPKYQIEKTSLESNSLYTESNLSGSDKLTLVCKMILNGNIQLFEFDSDFQYEFGQKNGRLLTSNNATQTADSSIIKSITTALNVTLNTSNYNIKDNEAIQLFAPNFITTTQYSTYVKFNFISSKASLVINQDITISSNSTIKSGSLLKAGSSLGNTSYSTDTTLAADVTDVTAGLIKSNSVIVRDSIINSSTLSFTIEAGQNYILQSTDTLTLRYTDSNDLVQTQTLLTGTVINCSIAINAPVTSQSISTTQWAYVLSSGETLDVKKINTSTIPAGINYYFIMNNPSNTMSIPANGFIILGENEYFIYTSSEDSNEFLLLGSGTKIFSSAGFSNTLAVIDSIDDIDVSSIEWAQLDDPLQVTELDIVTLGSGAQIKVAGNDLALTSNAVDLTSQVTTTVNGVTSTYFEYPDSDGIYKKWQIRSILNINSTPTNPQYLDTNQSMSFIFKDTFTSTVSAGNFILFNEALALSGGTNINAQVLSDTGTLTYSLKAYLYDNYENVQKFTRINNYLQIYGRATNATLNSFNTSYSESLNWLPFVFSTVSLTAEEYWLLPVYLNISNMIDVKEEISLQTNDIILSGSSIAVGSIINGSTIEVPTTLTSDLTITSLSGDLLKIGSRIKNGSTIAGTIWTKSVQLKTASSFTEPTVDAYTKSNLNPTLNENAYVDVNNTTSRTLEINDTILNESQLIQGQISSIISLIPELSDTSLIATDIVKEGSNIKAGSNINDIINSYDYINGSDITITTSNSKLIAGSYVASGSKINGNIITTLATKTEYKIQTTNVTNFDQNLFRFDDSLQTSLTTLDTFIMQVPKGSPTTFYNIKIVMTNLNDDDSILIGNINKTIGINTSGINVLASSDNNYSSKDNFEIVSSPSAGVDYQFSPRSVYNRLIALCGAYNFNWVYKVNSSDQVLLPTLSESYWNSNHIANDYVLPFIDFEHSSIKVNTYSIIS